MGEWVSTTLGDICRLRNGKAYKKTELLDSGPYPVLRVGNFFTNRHWYYSDLELEDSKYCDDGDLLYAWSASFGPRIWDGGKVIYHYHIWRVDFDESLVDKMYLYYWFEWDAEKIKKEQGAGTTMVHVSMKSMNARALTLPPLAEQKRIVAILDEAFAAIDKAIASTEKNIANARELFDSYLNNVFTQKGEGWVETTLGDEIHLQSGFAFKSKQYVDDSVDSVPLLRGDNIVQGALRWRDAKRWPATDTGDYEKFWLAVNDVVIAMDRTWVKSGLKYARITESDLPSLLVQRVARLRVTERMDASFLFHLIGSKLFERYVLSIQTGLGVPHISGQQIKDFRFSRPPFDTQQDLSIQIDSVSANTNRVTTVNEARAEHLSHLKQSILQKAFSGELTSDTKATDKALAEAGV